MIVGNSFFSAQRPIYVCMIKKIFKKVLSTLIVIVVLASIGGGGLLIWRYHFNRTIGQLLEENKELQEAITNLKTQRQIGYAKVISQVEVEGKLITKLKFVETDRKDMLSRY